MAPRIDLDPPGAASYSYAAMSLDLHPLVVHFPVALVVAALLIDWGRWLFDRPRLLNAGFWGGTTPLLILALLTAAVAFFTGLSVEENAGHIAGAHELVESHELSAFLFTAGLAVLAFWRIAVRGAFPRKNQIVYLVLLLVVAVIAGYAAYLGGTMVFEHGVGVRGG
jgi:uncharacterized membrane protein